MQSQLYIKKDFSTQIVPSFFFCFEAFSKKNKENKIVEKELS